ncbi:NADH-quinone oxidoreductase subunit NuoK [Pelagibacteraceae bacterium]|jgi:NADH-quinone oxidoreductase subunit K|nr:NADH-quinone oxidoreductase subunit NuoK [Pelagibacteraceae bacterium]|tara:strand:- start:285 stop:596 length:312 start_codon:yes stop_codon:yes gene_type:complete
MINIELGHYLSLGGVIFLLGVVGIFLNRKNIIVILMSVELILLSVNINLIAFSTYSNEIVGQIFTFFILTVAAAEAAIGLAIIVSYYRNKGSIRVQDINEMKG